MTKKLRVRNARYPDAHHIEALLQTAIADVDAIQIPPIARPHILNYLNFNIARAQVILAVVDGNLAGFVVTETTTFPWNPDYGVFAVSMFLVAKQYREDGAAEALIAELVTQAQNASAPVIFRETVAIDGGLTEEMLATTGLTKIPGGYCFQPAAPMENPEE